MSWRSLFTFYAFVCWHIVTASLVLGASDSIAALTGANVIACCFLLPAGIAICASHHSNAHRMH